MPTNTKRKGIIWAKDYPTRTYLQFSDQCTQKFYHQLTPAVSHEKFELGDPGVSSDGDAIDNCLQQDITSVAFRVVGTDSQFAEAVDILYFCGHGWQSGLYFVVPGLDNDDEANCADMRLSDDGVLKWFVMDACKVLENNGVFARWTNVFNGSKRNLRYLLGFHTNCKNDNWRGGYFSDELNLGQTIPLAWSLACEYTDEAAWAYLRIGSHDNNDVESDKWTDDDQVDIFSKTPSEEGVFTYKRLSPPMNTTLESENS